MNEHSTVAALRHTLKLERITSRGFLGHKSFSCKQGISHYSMINVMDSETIKRT